MFAPSGWGVQEKGLDIQSDPGQRLGLQEDVVACAGQVVVEVKAGVVKPESSLSLPSTRHKKVRQTLRIKLNYIPGIQ